MRILIQHAGTGLYLCKGKRWSPTPQEALAFLDEVRARDHCIYHRLAQGVVVVLPENHVPEGVRKDELTSATPSVKPNHIEEENMKSKRIGRGRPASPKPVTKTRTPAKPPLLDKPPGAGPLPSAGSVELVAAPAPPQPEVLPVPQSPATVTTIEAEIDVGFGNALFIRGQGAGLSWQKSLPMICVDGSTWIWSTGQAPEKLLFKFLLNDLVWCQGEDLTIEAGQRAKVVPVFQ